MICTWRQCNTQHRIIALLYVFHLYGKHFWSFSRRWALSCFLRFLNYWTLPFVHDSSRAAHMTSNKKNQKQHMLIAAASLIGRVCCCRLHCIFRMRSGGFCCIANTIILSHESSRNTKTKSNFEVTIIFERIDAIMINAGSNQLFEHGLMADKPTWIGKFARVYWCSTR